MEADEGRRGKDPAALSGGHLCHVCGYQYPNPNPSAKLRRSHRKHCGKAPAPGAVPEAGEAAVRVAVGVGERGEGGAGARNAGERTAIGTCAGFRGRFSPGFVWILVSVYFPFVDSDGRVWRVRRL